MMGPESFERPPGSPEPSEEEEKESITAEQREGLENAGFRIKKSKKREAQEQSQQEQQQEEEGEQLQEETGLLRGALTKIRKEGERKQQRAEKVRRVGKRAKGYAKAVEAGIRGVKEGWLEKSAERKEIEKELKEMRVEERGKVGLGLQNIGFFVEEWKDNFFAEVFGNIAETVDKKGKTKKFWETLGKNFEKDAKNARGKIKETEEGRKKVSGKSQLANVGYLTGNILKYGRTIADVAGRTLTSPLRYVMLGGMAFARGAGAAKEARLLSEGTIEKTRIEDADRAAEIAWGIYEQAQSAAGDRPITAKELQEIYQSSVPESLIERLRKNPEAGVVSRVLQGVVKKDLGSSVKRIEKKIQKVEANNKLSAAEKKTEKQKILDRASRHLDFLDRAVSEQGTVDMFALSAKYAETAAKAVVAGTMAETVALGMERLWEWRLADIFSSSEKVTWSPETLETPTTEQVPPPPSQPEGAVADTMPSDTAAAAEAPAPAEAMEANIYETAASAGAEEYVEEIGKRGIWGATESQLEHHYKEAFTESGEAQRTWLIDSIKDDVVANPGKYLQLPEGYDINTIDIDNLPQGTKLDLSSIIQDESGMMERFGEIGILSPEQVEVIERNNETLREWVREHPGESLTSEKVEEILRGETAVLEQEPVVTEQVPVEQAPAEQAQQAIPSGRRGEFIIPDSDYLRNARVQFSYDSETGLPFNYSVIGGEIPDFNPENNLKSNWFEILKEKFQIDPSVDRASIAQDDELMSQVNRLEVLERASEGFPEDSPERELIEKSISDLGQQITETYGDVLISETQTLPVEGMPIPPLEEMPEPRIEIQESVRPGAAGEIRGEETVVPEAETPMPPEPEVRPEAETAPAEPAVETAQEAMATPGREPGEFVIAESGPLYNASIRFSYDQRTGLPIRHNIRGGRFFGFNPESKLKDGWFETMSRKLNITVNRGYTPHDNYLLREVEDLERLERITEKLPGNSPEARYLVRVIGETRRAITERFGEVLKTVQ
jgi:hypothetical protein